MPVNIEESISKFIGAPEASIRLLISLFIPYIFAFLYKTFLQTYSATVKNRFLVICGVLLSVYNYGASVCHSLGAVIFSYALLQVVPPSSTNVIINFIFHMCYLLCGYWVNANDLYDFTWTLPHCVLTLRLIGLSFDLWDGSQDPEKLSPSFKKNALKRQPTFLEMMSYVFFPATYLIGPQFPLIKYYDYIEGKYDEFFDHKTVKIGLKRCLIGIGYMVFHQVGSLFVNENLFLDPQFMNSNIFKKHLVLAILCKVFIAKYLACWLIGEGACIMFGMAYNGKDENDEILWDGCRNVKLDILEGITKYNQYVESFNINTNAWVAQYIYKRFKFLNNPMLSRLFALLFLALWHGVYTGYYIAFIMQFFIIIMEKDLDILLPKYFPKFVEFTHKSFMAPFRFVFFKLYATIFLGFAVIPFALLKFDRWWAVYRSLYFSGFVIFMPYMFLYKSILMMYIKKYCKTEQNGKKEQ